VNKNQRHLSPGPFPEGKGGKGKGGLMASLFCLLGIVAINFLGCGETELERRVVVEGVWVRENIPPQKITAAYLVLRNAGPATALVSAKTDVAEVTELHVMTARENVMRMRKAEGIPIPAGGVATLQPGGNHLMLIGLVRDLVLGETIDLTLGFGNGQTVVVQAVVRAIDNGQ
jgi:copper(I)-binding protein